MPHSRRTFLTTAGATGLALAFRVVEFDAQSATPATAPFSPNAYLEITSGNVITFWVTRMEMGQGVGTLLPMMMAEELDVPVSALRLRQAEPDARFTGISLHTSGSGSSRGAFRDVRQAGATARAMLVAAAAEAWSVDASTLRTEDGAVIHAGLGRRATYGELAGAAARQPVPAAAPPKTPDTFKILGRPMARLDNRAIVTGAARYGVDVTVPGMRYASVLRAPAFGACVANVDSAAALRVPGVQRVAPVTTGIHPGVAVVATNSWAAMRGRAALQVTWTDPTHPFDSDAWLRDLPARVDRANYKVRHEGDARAALTGAARRLEATYTFPFEAHAPMEPMNCTADVRADRAEFWVPTQTAVRSMAQAVKVTGLPKNRITIHPVLMGGGFGRRLFSDFVAEAAEISKAIGAPVQVLWTREDDLQHGYFQPATCDRFIGGLDASGRLVAVEHRTSSSDLTIYDIHDGRNIWQGPPPAAKAANAYEQDQSPWGAYDNPYEIPNLRVDCADVTSPVPVGPWRAVEYPATVFARESFLDELAHAAGMDPVTFRLSLLPEGVRQVGPYAMNRSRLARALELVRARSGWAQPLPAAAGGTLGRGVSASVYHAGSYLALVAEVFVPADRSRIDVRRITVAVDCGIALNPLGVRNQTEGGVVWGLAAALFGPTHFVNGAAVERNFNRLQLPRMRDVPPVEVHLIDGQGQPGGYGEHAVPLVAPAIANAVFAATGQRLRALPLQLTR